MKRKQKDFTYAAVIIFIIGVISSLLYYLEKYYVETNLIFNENQFGFYLVFVIVVIACFAYLIWQNHKQNEHMKNQNVQIENLSAQIVELSEQLSSCYDGTFEAIVNATSITLANHKMLKDGMDKHNG